MNKRIKSECYNCGASYSNDNIYGRFCKECGEFMPPPRKTKIEEEAKIRNLIIQETIREALKKRILGE